MTPEVKYLSYRLTLKAPAIVTTLSGDPNSAATQRYIPGSTIRGAVAARLLHSREAGDQELFTRLVLSYQVRYLNAYPEIGSARTLPIPASWRRLKYDHHSPSCAATRLKAIDLAGWQQAIPQPPAGDQPDHPWPQDPLTSLAAPFRSPESYSGSFRLLSPTCGARLHQQRDRIKGRPWSSKDQGREINHGTIFAYEYLQAGQSFHGVVQLWKEARDLEDRLKELMKQAPLLLGRSRRAGYGGMAEVKFLGTTEQEYPCLADAKEGSVAPEKRFRALLVSAYLGRDPHSGQIDPAALGPELERRLQGKARVEQCFWRFQTVGGFNRKWRLPLPQALAVAPGAVLVLKAEEEIPLALLQEVMHQGLGLRRNEGFGRVVFLDHDSSPKEFSLQEEEAKARESQEAPSAPQEEQKAEKAIRDLERRIVLNAARARLEQRAHLLAQEAAKLPPNSLLGRLRTLLRPVRDEPSAGTALQKLRDWCRQNDSKPASPALKKLEDCRVTEPVSNEKETTLRQWLQEPSPPDAQDGGGYWAFLRPWGRLGELYTRTYLTDPEAAKGVLQENSAVLAVHLVDSLLAELALRNRREKP